MKNSILLVVLSAILGIAVYACGRIANPTGPVSSSSFNPSEIPSFYSLEEVPLAEVTLCAARYIDVGSVTIWNDTDNLYIKYATSGGGVISKTHLAVAPSLEAIPKTKSGNPKVGRFPFKTSHEPTVVETIHAINLDVVGFSPGDEIYIAAHANVVLYNDVGDEVQSETAWGNGTSFPGHNWAMYFTYEIVEGSPPCYVEDFSQDPGWVTNNPSRYFWDQDTETYYADYVNNSWDYGTRTVEWNGGSFLLEYDLELFRVDWSSGFVFGFYQADRHVKPDINVIIINYFHADPGHGIGISAASSSGNQPGAWTVPPWQTNTWYHNVLIYDKESQTMQLQVTTVDGKAHVASLTLDGVGPFEGLCEIGVSNYGEHQVISGRHAIGLIDNVRFCQSNLP